MYNNIERRIINIHKTDGKSFLVFAWWSRKNINSPTLLQNKQTAQWKIGFGERRSCLKKEMLHDNRKQNIILCNNRIHLLSICAHICDRIVGFHVSRAQ